MERKKAKRVKHTHEKKTQWKYYICVRAIRLFVCLFFKENPLSLLHQLYVWAQNGQACNYFFLMLLSWNYKLIVSLPQENKVCCLPITKTINLLSSDNKRLFPLHLPVFNHADTVATDLKWKCRIKEYSLLANALDCTSVKV